MSGRDVHHRGRSWGDWLRLAVAVALIHLVLIQPNHPHAMTWGALRLFPLELPVILIALLAAPRALLLPLRLALATFLTIMPVVKLADYGTHTAYSRGFNLILDVHLLPSAWELTTGAIGIPLAALAVLAALAAIVALGALMWWATGQVAALRLPRAAALTLGVAAIPAVTLAAIDIARTPFNPPGAAFTARLAGEHVARIVATRSDLARFADVAASDPFAGLAPETVMADLSGRDVLILFVESYGRSALDNPRYRPTILPRLEGIEADLAAAGLAMRSAWVTAPMVGGQSWLAHASVLSGLWIDSQLRNQALLASPRRTLLHYARDAGWRTVAITPAIVRPWPEGGFFGYDAIHAAADLGYRGLPFNWVTMPDQFTLKAFERLELLRSDRPPLFAKIALISSHAPWTPVPELVAWDLIGDGRIFDEMAQAGDPPEVVWRDRDRVRDQFRLALDYSLEVVGSFAQRHAAATPVMIVLGDHEPAPFVAEIDSFDVPIHVIGPAEVVERAAEWGWTEGLVPGDGAPVWTMDRLRDILLATFTPGAELAGRLARDTTGSGSEGLAR